MNEKAIVFLDLLGFGQTALNDPTGAINLILDYQTILDDKITDKTINPNLSNEEEDLYADSFEYLLPFSDSIFITSQDTSKFIRQLSHLLRHSFDINSYDYSNPDNRDNPIEVPETYINFHSKTIEKIRVKRYPVLFRGGLSFGVVNPINIKSLSQKTINDQVNLTGPAVVKAVGLEKSGKGPRLFADSNFYGKVPTELKYSFAEIKKNELYEFLWTAFNYQIGNNSKNEIESFSSSLLPALNLWKAFNHYDFGIQYFEFIRLIIKGTIAHF